MKKKKRSIWKFEDFEKVSNSVSERENNFSCSQVCRVPKLSRDFKLNINATCTISMKRKTRQTDKQEEEDNLKVKNSYKLKRNTKSHPSVIFFQRKISILRIVDLHSILVGFSYAKNARKDDLQKQTLELLRTRETTEAEKQEIRRAIQSSYSKM